MKKIEKNNNNNSCKKQWYFQYRNSDKQTQAQKISRQHNTPPVIDTMLQTARELREKAQKEVGNATNYTN